MIGKFTDDCRIKIVGYVLDAVDDAERAEEVIACSLDAQTDFTELATAKSTGYRAWIRCVNLQAPPGRSSGLLGIGHVHVVVAVIVPLGFYIP